MKIRIIEGTYGYRPDGINVEPVHTGECIDLEDQEAARLVKLGVAERADEIPSSTESGVATDPERANPGEAGDNTPDKETPAQGQDAPETAHLDPEQFESWKVADLKKMAAEMGIEVHTRATKAELIAAITAEPVTPGPAVDAPPALSADTPV